MAMMPMPGGGRGPSPALASNAFLASLGVRHAVGAVANQRRGAVTEHVGEGGSRVDGGAPPPPDLAKRLREFERRRGVNHMQLFLEQLVSEILETQTATRGLAQLQHVRALLEECIRNVQVLVMKGRGGGRDPKGLMQLRSSFLMLSLADRESRVAVSHDSPPPKPTRRERRQQRASSGRGGDGGGGGSSQLVEQSKSLPNISERAGGRGAEAEAPEARAEVEALEKELGEARKLAKRLRTRHGGVEKEAQRVGFELQRTQRALEAEQARAAQLEQRLRSSDLALRNEKARALKLAASAEAEARLSRAEGGGGAGAGSGVAAASLNGGQGATMAETGSSSIFQNLQETETERALRV
eukprot:SAG25_NODE_599_length_6648_cov_22.861964_8_plen_355_part_01